MTNFSVIDAARETPEQIALITGEDSFTYAKLAERVKVAIAFLISKGALCFPQKPVALIATLELPTLEVLYALMELGIPVLLLHPRWTLEERNAVIQRAQSSMIFDSAEYIEKTTLPGGMILQREVASEEILALIATSGTTGQPKIAKLSRRAFTNAAVASGKNLGWAPDDRWLLCLSLAHIGGLSVVTRCLLARRCVVVFDPGPAGLLTNLPQLNHVLYEQQVTLLSVVPSVLARWLDAPPDCKRHRLRAVLVGGASASPALLAQAEAQGVPVLTTYGFTEACSQVATQMPNKPRDICGALASVGHPLSGFEVRTVNGNIEVRGGAMFSGYLGEPAPQVGNDWYPTGDRGFISSTGELYVLGRADDLIISGGENIDPTEVEAVLESLDMIVSACVIGVPDPMFGQCVAAAVVMRDGARFSVQELVQAYAGRLASFKRPRYWAFLDALPCGPTGKLDRSAVRAALHKWQSC